MSRNERLWLCLGLLALLAVEGLSVAMAGPRVHIPDELDDVEDNEEDEEWKEWGKAKESPVPFDPPPDPPEDPQELEKYQLEMMKRQTGPSMGFVKLRLGVQRSPEETTRIAEKWTDLLKTGSINAKIYAVDRSTIMFILSYGQDTTEVKDFVLSQDEAYEFKLGNSAFRRPGDPPVEEVLDKMHAEKKAQEKASKKKEPKKVEAKSEDASIKEEL
ncbi:uncharacterized protein [Physcomitrium patens]|uniref:Mesoderm development candidate 2 n=1 Tax=Physcomitrium patens TaxID=3218 RepID=A0A2K1JG51_PHYPA|nr:uncharacterized protein LOC112291026 [Physcomitrium patens]PNR40507.1 hypothetical protein PHYPA_017909 [Physcomitrium patens]|eukprot:XP_024393728.1 uncharacterized protein LOC112291026 [Physcomitrella patens]